MQLNAKQIAMLVLAMIGFTATGIQQLEPVIGVTAVKAVGSICTFIGGLMAAALTPYLSNSSVVLDAKAQKGVDVQIDRTASPQLALMAMDPKQNSIAPAPGEFEAVKQVAEGVAA